jgi:hypothetical protein
MLDRRATGVTTSPDAWERITERTGPAARVGGPWRRPVALSLAAVAAVLIVAGVLVANRDDDGQDVAAGPSTTEPTDDGCRPAIESDSTEADDALRLWFNTAHATRDFVEISPEQPRPFVITGFLVTGDRMRSADRAEFCVRTYWASDPEEGSGDFAGHTDDVYAFERGVEGWSLAGVTRSRLREAGEFSRAPVAMLALEGGECGESDSAFEMVPGAIVLDGDDLLTVALQALFTGFFVTGAPDHQTALPADARLLSADLDTRGVAHVEVSASADRGGGSCLQNARKEQIRRTALAVPGVSSVAIRAGDRAEDESFQP